VLYVLNPVTKYLECTYVMAENVGYPLIPFMYKHRHRGVRGYMCYKKLSLFALPNAVLERLERLANLMSRASHFLPVFSNFFSISRLDCQKVYS